MPIECRDCPFRRYEEGLNVCAWDSENVVPCAKIEECPMEDES
jgi:hypothetical protein